MEAKELLSSDAAMLLTAGRKQETLKGFRSGIPIAIGYIPIAIAFGLLAKSAGVPNYISLMMSCVVFAGASQFVGVNLIALGTGLSEIVLTTFILNLRHFLMSASLYQRIEQPVSKGLLLIMSFGITDETFSVSSMQKEKKLSIYYLLSLNLVAFLAWVLGTAIGIFLADGLPDTLKHSMGIALYAMFIGLLFPSIRKSIPILAVAGIAAGVHSILHWLPVFAGLSTGWAIILSTVIASAAGGYFFREGHDHE